ncbi:MAG: YeiH family protein [Roseiarcus sp.]
MTTEAWSPPRTGWRELWSREDWWAIWLGLGIVLVGLALFEAGGSLRWLAVLPAKWSSFDKLGADLAANWLRYVAQFAFWLVIFSAALTTLGFSARRFVPAFIFLYIAALVVFCVGQWDQASYYNLEPPLLALLVGLMIANLIGLPRWLDAGFRVEFYVKTGIVLLGATVPFSLVILAGPTAILQASIVSITTFLAIYFAAVKLGLDRRLAATLGAGGAVCGVSGAIAIAGAVGAKREHAPIAITLVIVWAIVMIFALPLASRAMHLSTGVAGAWIGTSEFADAAGYAAATAYGALAGKVEGIAGAPEQATLAFTLMKVVGRDVWIGIWAFVLAIVATTYWDERPASGGPDAGEIWRRFPKFVIGFVIASLIISAVTAHYGFAEFNKIATPGLIAPIRDMRTWAFIFCFLSIGLTTRFSELAEAGRKPLGAFTIGVAVNVMLGWFLSTVVFADHWTRLGQ